MTNLQFVKNEIKRYNKRHGTKHNTGIAVEHNLDWFGNFVSVALLKMVESEQLPQAIGYAKCNPCCDEYDVKTGLSIATFRALRRIDGRTP